MINFSYLKISKLKKIRYIKKIRKNAPYIVFLHGFMSNLEGKKPKAFLNFAIKNKLGFLSLEYSGHGKSSGKFIDGNISKWSKETTVLIKKVVKKNYFFLVGSSMGAWIALNQFKFFKKKIKGFLGIGSAPEFLENLMWRKFSKKIKSTIIQKKIYYLKQGNYEYPITHQLIKNGKQNKIFNKKFNENIKVVMIHGDKDKVVPKLYSKKILKIFNNAQKKLVIIKNGDHSLSNKKNLNIILKELSLII
ncbi:MAG: alpha/beta hydrolase [Alphaproteobacteria bacterium]|nr:alpha/beta hydrolase [Alphaproteobacteria bacterium]